MPYWKGAKRQFQMIFVGCREKVRAVMGAPLGAGAGGQSPQAEAPNGMFLSKGI